MQQRIYKGDCGICGDPIYNTDLRFRRVAGEPYICAECWAKVETMKCFDCTEIFDCPEDHDDSRCKE